MNKKFLFLLTFLLFFSFFWGFTLRHVQATELYNPLSYAGGLDTPGEKIVVNLVAQVLSIVYNIIVGLSLIFIIIGGIMYMLSLGNEEKTTRAKKMVIMAVMGLSITIGAAVFLKTLALAVGVEDTSFWGTNGIFQEVPGIMDSGTEVQTGLQVTQNVLNLLLSILGMLGIIGIVLGGIWYMTSAGSEDRMEMGRKTLIYSIIGLVVAIGSLIIVKQIDKLFH